MKKLIFLLLIITLAVTAGCKKREMYSQEKDTATQQSVQAKEEDNSKWNVATPSGTTILHDVNFVDNKTNLIKGVDENGKTVYVGTANMIMVAQ